MTERFEMRLGTAVLEEVDAWRTRQGDLPSRAEAIRRLIEVGLAATSSRSKKQQVQLTAGDKLILLMLRDLFKQLKPKDAETDPDFIAEVIFGGHSWGLDWKYTGVFHGHEDKEEVVSEVVDILDMWSFLEWGYQALSEAHKTRVAEEAAPLGKHVRFNGFDGNNEAEYIGVTRFLIEQLDRFTSFKGREFDAHLPTVDGYRRMLAVFEPIRRTLTGRELSADEIIQILKAWVHPSRRTE